MSRFEFNTPIQTSAGMVYGYSEVLLQEPAVPTKGAEFMHVRSTLPMPKQQDEGKVTYGSMPGAMMSRNIDLVKDETVEVNGVTVSFTQLIEVCNAFFEKWRVEDENTPQPTMIPPPVLPPPVRMDSETTDETSDQPA
jgi:hypothetical protein